MRDVNLVRKPTLSTLIGKTYAEALNVHTLLLILVHRAPQLRSC